MKGPRRVDLGGEWGGCLECYFKKDKKWDFSFLPCFLYSFAFGLKSDILIRGVCNLSTSQDKIMWIVAFAET